MLQKLIEQNFQARERKNKNRAVAYVLKQQYNILDDIPLEFLERLVREVTTMDREWRLIMQRNPHLRGSDYGDKDALELAKLESLGYGEQMQIKI